MWSVERGRPVKVAALIVNILAALAALGGMFVYALGSTFICVDVCPSVSSASQQLPVVAGVTLGPGILLSLAACILSMLYVRSQGRPVWFVLTLVTPLAVGATIVTLLLLLGGSLTPVAVSGPADVAPADRQVSVTWLTATTYAVIPLLVWPLVSLAAALTRRNAG
jgi:hypothetical protein